MTLAIVGLATWSLDSSFFIFVVMVDALNVDALHCLCNDDSADCPTLSLGVSLT